MTAPPISFCFELGQSVEIELVRTGVRVSTWTLELVGPHVWLELDAVVELSGGERIKLYASGADGAWCLDAEVAEVRDPGVRGIALVKVIVAGRPVAVQRRDYFRVPATVPVTLSVTASRDARRVIGDLVAMTTVDLSGGGLQLETDHALIVGDVLELSLGLPVRVIRVSGTVTRVATAVHCNPMRVPGRADTRLVGVELGAMMERDRAELVRFVHDVERKLRSTRGG